MAHTTISGTDYSPVVGSREYTSVWVKKRWANSWTYVPYLFPVQTTEAAPPSTSSASFRWEYGEFVNLWNDAGGTLYPWSLDGWYIAVQAHTEYSRHLVWVGVIQSDVQEFEGNTSSGNPTGVQTLRAVGLETLLDRRRVIGSYGGNGTFVGRTIPFNQAVQRGVGPSGNMSTLVDPVTGSYVFSDDAAAWSNGAIAGYLLTNFQPSTPRFLIVGQYTALFYMFQEWDFHGKTIRECLNALIDKRRGLSWKIVTDGVGYIYIYVYSVMVNPVFTPEIVVPANPMQGDADFSDSHHVDVSIEVTNVSKYDQIVVESESPITTTFSVGYSYNGLLEPDWDAADQAGYDAASVTTRARDNFANVYSHLRVPDSFNWNGVTVQVLDHGGLLTGAGGTYSRLNKTFLRYTGLLQEDTTNPEQKEPFAVIPETGYVFLDKADSAGLPASSMRMLDRDMGVEIRSAANHVFAINDFDTGTYDAGDHEPVWDWRALIATVAVELDHHLRVVMYSYDFGANETGKQMHIVVPGAECWIIAAGTVTGLSGGNLVTASNAYTTRNDVERLRTIAAMAAAWYQQQRAIATIEIKNLLPWFQVGNLIRTSFYGRKWDWLGTPVTEITRNYMEQTQTVRTGWSDVDPQAFVEHVVNRETQSLARRLRYVERGIAGLPSRIKSGGGGGGGTGEASNETPNPVNMTGGSAGTGEQWARYDHDHRGQDHRQATTRAGLPSSDDGTTALTTTDKQYHVRLNSNWIYLTVETVESLPSIPTAGVRRVFWTSDGAGTGDDQVWEAYAGQSAWTPCQALTTKSGTP